VESRNFIAQREIKYAPGGQKFEPGAYTYSVIAGLGAAIELLQEAGPAQITERILSLTRALERDVAPAGFEFLSPEEVNHRSGMLTFRHPKIPSERLLEALLKKDAVVSLRFDRADRSWLRVSPHFYNTFDEMTKIAGVLNQGAAV
jgi:selenocysteine lyase/cysteine desulfurase